MLFMIYIYIYIYIYNIYICTYNIDMLMSFSHFKESTHAPTQQEMS